MKNIKWYPVKDVLDVLENEEWMWPLNARCKYVDIRIDTRDMMCTIKDRNGEYITIEDLRRQYGKDPK